MAKLISLAAIASAFFVSDAGAARLLRFVVMPDGSTNPPGDSALVEAFVGSNEQPLTFEVRALVAGERSAMAVRSKNPGRAAAGGELIWRATASGIDGRPGFVRASFVFAYADFELPVGSHSLYYELTARQGGRIAFVRASKVTTVEVANLTRLEMKVRSARPVAQTQVVEKSAIVCKDGRAETIRFQESQTQMRTVQETKTVQVNIPGGFQRFVPRFAARYADNDVGMSLPPGGTAWEPLRNRVIYFATTRQLVNPTAQRLRDRFSNAVGSTVEYGSCLVNIPTEEAYERGKLEIGTDPARHFFVERVGSLTDEDFFNLASQRLANAESPNDVIVAVHGFNNSFEFATLRLAQLVHDLRFTGLPVLFAWPSMGETSLGAYRTDEGNAMASCGALADVLNKLVARRRQAPIERRGRIHVLAHSLGNRLLMRSLIDVAANLQPDEKAFGHIVLAAPDIGLSAFAAQVVNAFRAAESVTLYFCAQDKALMLSRNWHSEARAGENLVIAEGLANIDASKANTSFLGHDYYISNSLLLIDMEMAIANNLKPSQRPTIRPRRTPSQPPYTYWFFP